MRRQDDDAVLADLAEQVEEPHTLSGIETGSGLVDDDERRVAEECDGDAEALAHAAGVAAQPLLAHVPQVGLAKQCLDDALPRRTLREPFEDGEVVQQPLCAHGRVDAEFLREVAEGATHAVLFAQDVDLPRVQRGILQSDGAGVGLLEGGDRAHEARLARAVGAQEAEHAARDRERDIVQRAHPVGVRLCEALDPEFHERVSGGREASVAVYVLHYICPRRCASG